MSNIAQSVTLQDAVLSQVKEFAAANTTFSVHDITTQIRSKVNNSQLEIPECEVPNASFRFDVSHAKVKAIFESLWHQGVFNPEFTLNRNFNKVYFEYTPVPVTQINNVTVATPSYTIVPTSTTVTTVAPAVSNDRATITARVSLYLNNCANRSFRPSLKQVQSAIKRGDVSTGYSCDDLKAIVEGLGFKVVSDPNLVSASQVVV